MSVSIKKATAEVDNNYDYFQTQIPQFKKEHANEFALLHKCQIIDFFEKEFDAYDQGVKDYGEGRFSVQAVSEVPIDLGWQSYGIL